WEPIVLTPSEAYNTFMQSEMDVLVLEDCVLHKNEQPLGLKPWSRSEASPLEESSPGADPVTREPLVVTSCCARNPVTGTNYHGQEGIPSLFVATDAKKAGEDVTEMVKAFYEKTPFPNYDDLDNQRDLLEKARAGMFARLLNEQIPYNARVVEIGCGT